MTTSRQSLDPKKPGKKKKWSLWRHWKSASRAKQAKWVAQGLLVASGVAGVAVYEWGNLQTKWNFVAEHKPIVIHSRDPELLQPIVCDPKVGFHSGNMVSAIKNIGNATAYHVIPYVQLIKIIPERKTGNAIFDEVPVGDCKKSVSMKDLEFPLAQGVEVFPRMRQSAGTIPPVADGDRVQLYMSECVYYSDEYGQQHGTCDAYRLYLPSNDALDRLSGSPSFVCDALPKTGKFGGALEGHCQE